MNVLAVTGGSGFIGSNFIRYVFEQTDFKGSIVNIDALTYAGSSLNLQDIQNKHKGRYVFAHVDICDQPGIEALFDEYEVDTVCHFAAESHVDRSILGPEAFVETNVMGTFRLLEVVRKRKHRIKRFHHVSTDEVFGSLGSEGLFTESSQYQPNSPYSASKAASDHFVRAYQHTYGLPITISNCSNNYGPHQHPEKFIPVMVLNMLEQKKLPIYGKGENVRDWLHVEDHCRAIWQILEESNIGAYYNVGGNAERSNLEVVYVLCDIMDALYTRSSSSHRDLVSFVADRPGHDLRYAIDHSKIKSELGWEPKKTFDEGLQETVRWYVENSDWVKAIKKDGYQKWAKENYGGRTVNP